MSKLCFTAVAELSAPPDSLFRTSDAEQETPDEFLIDLVQKLRSELAYFEQKNNAQERKILELWEQNYKLNETRNSLEIEVEELQADSLKLLKENSDLKAANSGLQAKLTAVEIRTRNLPFPSDEAITVDLRGESSAVSSDENERSGREADLARHANGTSSPNMDRTTYLSQAAVARNMTVAPIPRGGKQVDPCELLRKLAADLLSELEISRKRSIGRAESIVRLRSENQKLGESTELLQVKRRNLTSQISVLFDANRDLKMRHLDLQEQLSASKNELRRI